MIRVAYIGDSPFIYSGFGVVSNAILSRLPEDEFEISVLGTMYPHMPKDTKYISYYEMACVHDLMGFKSSISFIQHVDPDLLFFIADPGTLRNRFASLMLTGMIGLIPAVTYFPLEGMPLNPHIVEQASMVHSPVTYTKWGMNEMKKYGIEVDYIYHGADHANFVQYDEDTKQKLKRLIGWENKFVVGLIGMNKRSNRQPVMLQAAQLLKERGVDDFVIYLHCQEQGEAHMGGWELGWQTEAYDVMDVIQLKPDQKEHKYIGRPRTGTLEYMLDLDDPEDKDEAVQNLSMLDFTSLLNVFDLYLDPASSHGWNLPASESARCGVPIATVDDGFARSEIFSDCAYMIEPTAFDHWHTGAILPLVSPKRIADTIEEFKNEPSLCEKYAKLCKAKFDNLKWQDTADLFADKFRAAHEYGVSEMYENSN